MTSLHLRNVTCDFYLDRPNGFNRSAAPANASKLPIIRMFGILESGQKCCVHVHGVFPYIIMRSGAPLTPQIESDIRSVIAVVTTQKNPRVPQSMVDNAIATVDPLFCRSIYGFYSKDDHFVKISFYSPQHAKLVSDALMQEAFSNASFQVYEAHIPYILQFFLDFSIFGMDIVHFRAVKFRVSPKRSVADKYFRDLTVGEIINDVSLISPLLPMTNVAVECDVMASEIANIEEQSKNEISSNPGLNFIWKDEERRCRERGMKLVTESSQEERRAPVSDNEKEWLHRLKVVARQMRTMVDEESPGTPLSAVSLDDTLAELNRTLAATQADTSNVEAIDENFGDAVFSFEESVWANEIDAERNEERAKESDNEDGEDMSQTVCCVCPSTSAAEDVGQAGPNRRPKAVFVQAGDNDDLTRSTTGGRSSFMEEDLTRLTSGLSEVSAASSASQSTVSNPTAAVDFSSAIKEEDIHDFSEQGLRAGSEGSSQRRSATSDDLFEDAGLASGSESSKTIVAETSPCRATDESNDSDLSDVSEGGANASVLTTDSDKSGDMFDEGSQGATSMYDDCSEDDSFSDHSSESPLGKALQTDSVLPSHTVGQPSKVRQKRRIDAESSVEVRAKRVCRGSLSYEKLVSSDDDLMPTPLEIFENDVVSLWNPQRPRKLAFHADDNDAFQATTLGRFEFDLVEREDEDEEDDVWITPSVELPLRKPTDPVEIEQSSSPLREESAKEAVLEFSQGAEGGNKMSNESIRESWYPDRSYNNYDGKVEKLEATLVLPAEPACKSDSEQSDVRHLCVMSMELLALVREGQPVPDPKLDAVVGIFFAFCMDVCVEDGAVDAEGAFVSDEFDGCVTEGCGQVKRLPNENVLFDAFVDLIVRFDPDIVIGYNTRRSSWGYLVERSIALGRNLLSEISRYPIEMIEYNRPEVATFELEPVPRGRLLVNVWRTLRHELALRSYTQSNVAQAVLNRRFPEYSHGSITEWVRSKEKHLVLVVLRHMALSAKLNLKIMCQLDLFSRTAEMARVYGIQFSEVLSRGSQFRVESMMLRLARKHKFAALSISPAQREAMCAPESLALTLEPESGLYRDPVIVLDFQSLYPSLMIAYNYCFSTCLGKVVKMEEAVKRGNVQYIDFGGASYTLPVKQLASFFVRNQLHISPVGGVFCKKSVRKGIIPLMVEEILNTRIMVKKAAKGYKNNPRLSRILDARQLALKLVANVTYGYAAANWSGRMPCVEVADAIVSKGREALERAIALVNSGRYGKSRVIYGDTDSLFVLCPGSSRSEAFDIGERIAEDVTLANPNPMKLKLEKIMHPCVLEAKKRYVGMSFERRDDVDGVFDAKGIETVRRDGCPLASRVLEKALRLLFADDLPAVVRYLDMQLSNLDLLPLSDFIFSRAYRGRGHYADSAVVAAKRIAEKRRGACERDEPEPGERVPYVIVDGEPNATLISCVREPWEYAFSKKLTLNFDYYVQRHVLPAIQRAFDYVPMKFVWRRPSRGDCFKCGAIGCGVWCGRCVHSSEALFDALCDFFKERRTASQMRRLCRECCGLQHMDMNYAKCVNMACAVTQKRIALHKSRAPIAVRTHELTAGVENLYLRNC